MNQAIDAILGHYSVRKFEDKDLTEEALTLLIKSAQAASTSSFVQAYSIIGITDKDIREQISAIAGNQPYTVQTGQLFIFVADLARSSSRHLRRTPSRHSGTGNFRKMACFRHRCGTCCAKYGYRGRIIRTWYLLYWRYS